MLLCRLVLFRSVLARVNLKGMLELGNSVLSFHVFFFAKNFIAQNGLTSEPRRNKPMGIPQSAASTKNLRTAALEQHTI